MHVNEKYYKNALVAAAKRGHLEIMKVLLDYGADVIAKAFEWGHTALQIASEKGHTDIVKLLKWAGAEE